MNFEFVLGGVEQYGYAALFFLLWLGIVGMPIPDEVIVMSGGFITSLGLLQPVPAFLLTYAGVVSGLSIGYGLGRTVGAPALAYLTRKKTGKYVEKANQLVNRYGAYSLIISYFFPVVRHVVPYIVGINKMPLPKYMLLSFSTGFVWTLILFFAGRYFGQYIERIGKAITNYGWISVIIFLVIVLVFITVNKYKVKQEHSEGSQES